MPFRSKAQQRYMYSQHPEIASRWTDEMRGGKRASKFQREHPIKAAGLPDRVGKAVLTEAAPVARRALSNRVATSSEKVVQRILPRRVRLGSPTAVGKSYVSKGVLRPSVKPVLALRTPAAGRSVLPRAPKPPLSVVGKAGGMGLLRAVRAAPKVARAGFRQGMSGAAKPKMGLGAATAMHSSRGLQGLNEVARFSGENRVGLSTGIVAGSVLGAGLARRDVEKALGGPVRRAKTYAEWAEGTMRPSGNGIGPKTLKRAQELSDKHGMTSPKGRRAFSVWQRDNNRKGSWRGMFDRDGRHVTLDDARWESGVYGLNTNQQRKMGVAARRREQGLKTSPVKRRRGVANDLQRFEHPDDFTDRVRRGQFQKAYGDPEDARYYRLGAGSAVLGGAGVAGVGAGAHRIVRDTQAERARIGKLPTLSLGSEPQFHEQTYRHKNKKTGKPTSIIRKPTSQETAYELRAHKEMLARHQKLQSGVEAVSRARATPFRGAAVRGRSAAMIGGGLAALGGADALRRRAHERRYD